MRESVLKNECQEVEMCKDEPWTVERFGFAVDPFVASQVVLSDKGSTAEANEQKQIVSSSSQE